MGQECVICDASRRVVTWCDQHGMAVCVACGTPYMLAGYSGRTETVCAIGDEAIPLLRAAYWSETQRGNGLGVWLGTPPAEVAADRVRFGVWYDAHPELHPAEPEAAAQA